MCWWVNGGSPTSLVPSRSDTELGNFLETCVCGQPADTLGPSHAPVAVAMRGTGGASAGLSSTWLQDGTEWSATGRLGVSLAGLSGLQDAAFARRRAVSRLREMCYSETWPPQPMKPGPHWPCCDEGRVPLPASESVGM